MLSVILSFAIAFNPSPLRVASGKVVQSTPAGSIIVTADGEEWCTYDQYTPGAVVVTFGMNGTPSIYDDVLLTVEEVR